jgi:hypothetical protein
MSTPPPSWPAPVVIDVEASGFGRGSYPIEVGLVLEDGTPHCFLVRPHEQWTHWDEGAAKVHKIPRAALFKRGLSVTTVAERLNEILDARTVYSDAWHFDRTWLALLFEFAGRLQRFKLESVRKLLNEAQAELWHPTVEAVTAELALARHRASADASIVQRALQRVGSSAT